MLGDDAHREILKDDYRRHRERAEKARERDEPDEAATHYRKCAELLDEIAGLESRDAVAKKRRDLAANLREAAETLAERASGGTGRDGSSANADAGATGGSNADSPDEVDADGDGEGDVADASEYLEDPPDLDFDDVGGMSDLKQTLIEKVVDPLERPELYEEYDLGVVNGVLLYGPPGTGKTYVTRALAGKLDYNFVEVTPSDLTSSLVGEAADNVADLFAVARDNQPCLVFVDEVDAIAGQRSGGAQKTQSERQMVNQILTELSDIQGEDVVVFAATNLLESVDDAIKRSGRFDERIEVPPPDPAARSAILRVHLRDRPVLTEEIDWETIEDRTEGYSASDMELVATDAARKALQDAREADEIRRITQDHLEAAIEETESSLADWEG
ncbi:MAG: 26S protease regulatory subunit [Haloarculaceae archaeon]